MEDRQILEHIRTLVDEEHSLYQVSSEGNPLSEGQEARLRDLEEHLDQCWDLLRQRRARRDAGLDPDAAHARDTDTVEHYRQ